MFANRKQTASCSIPLMTFLCVCLDSHTRTADTIVRQKCFPVSQMDSKSPTALISKLRDH